MLTQKEQNKINFRGGNNIYPKEYMISRKPTKNEMGLFCTTITLHPANTFPQTIICMVFGKTEIGCLENARDIVKGLNVVCAIKSINEK